MWMGCGESTGGCGGALVGVAQCQHGDRSALYSVMVGALVGVAQCGRGEVGALVGVAQCHHGRSALLSHGGSTDGCGLVNSIGWVH